MGSQRRILSVYQYLLKQNCSVKVLFVGSMPKLDQEIVASFFPMEFFVVVDPTSEKARFFKKYSLSSICTLIKKLIRQCWLAFSPANTSHWQSGIDREPSLLDFRLELATSTFRQLCQEFRPDFVLVEYLRLAYVLDGSKALPRGFITILDTHDVMHIRMSKFHERNERHDLNITRKEEARVLNRFDLILGIQQDDVNILKAMAPSSEVILVGHPCKTDPLPNPNASGPVSIGFIASDMAPNKAGLDDFLDHVWPCLREKFGEDILFLVAGSICNSAHISTDPQVRYIGFVDDVDDFYKRVSIIVNPVTFGGGLKIKTVEAMAKGRVVVTSLVGVDGLSVTEKDGVLVSSTIDEFVSNLERLIADRSETSRLSRLAREYAQSHFSESACYSNLMAALRQKNDRTDVPSKLGADDV